MLKTRSIFTIITISFTISLLLIIISFYLLNRNLEYQKQKYMQNRITYFNHRHLIDIDNIENLGYKIIDNPKNILKNSQTVYKTQMGRKSIYYLKNDKKFYIYIKSPFHTLLLKDLKHISYNKKLFFIIFFVTILTLIILYIIVIKKLFPLKKLHTQIKKLANEEFDIDLNIQGDDEIASLAKEFQKSTKKLKELKLSRDIFIRNIMHELKTPITKGKLLLSLPNEEKNRELLEKVFYRLQNLVDEFSQIERFLSLKKGLNLKNYYLDDLIDSALDISLYDEENLKKEYQNIKLKVDFKLFIIALKNLIDNGIKYSPKQKITIKTKKESILFINEGKKLQYPLESYFEPSYSEKNERLSLGIYITNSILKSHNFKLQYHYENEQNIFEVVHGKIDI